MKYSIIIPFYNEQENAATVINEVLESNPNAEVIAVDDGSKDHTLRELQAFDNRILILAATANRGQSAAMYAGMRAATYDWIALMDGDGQNDPADFPKLYDELSRSGADFACGLYVFVDWCSVGFDAWRCHRDRVRLAAMLARQSARVISCLLWCH